MAIQTSINNNPALAYAGLLSDTWHRDIISRKAQVDIAAGLFVVNGTADDQCKLPTLTTDVTGFLARGVAMFDPTMPVGWPPGSTAVQYPSSQEVAIVRKGRVWVTVEEAVTPASPVFVRFAVGSFATLGAFRASADTASAVQLQRANYTTTAANGGLALLEINLV